MALPLIGCAVASVDGDYGGGGGGGGSGAVKFWTFDALRLNLLANREPIDTLPYSMQCFSFCFFSTVLCMSVSSYANSFSAEIPNRIVSISLERRCGCCCCLVVVAVY